ncbi:MAG TPA: DUF6065 family protein [Tepidisphaeraceae bacterium]|nr:DUF6065 family protein [Tepidisphaeraceae bacterium]
MIRYFKFRQDLFDPAPAKDVYVKRQKGKGWPDECPPIRAAQGFGYDILANFDIEFVQQRGGGWRVEPDVVVESDFDWSAHEDAPGRPLHQQYAWFWEQGQQIPHRITDNVFAEIRNQVKLSSFLYLKTDPNEILLMTGIPNLRRSFWTWTAMIEPDWYPASYPWHAVIELDPKQKRVRIEKGEPICRIVPVRRDTYFAEQMSPEQFDAFFEKGQQWLRVHGRPPHGESEAGDAPADGTLDITRTYVRQQARSRFLVLP